MAILDTGHPLPALFVPGGLFYSWPYTRRNIQTAETYISNRIRKQNGTNLPNGSGAPASGPDPSPSPPAQLPSPILGSGPILPHSTHEPAHELDIGANTLQEMNYDISFEMAPDISDGHTAITADDLDFSNMESELNTDTIDRITDGRWLNDATIAKLLELFSSLRPLDAKSIDPLLVDRAPINNAMTYLLSTSGSDLSVLVPDRCNAHWILVVLRAADKSVLYYISMPGHDMPNLPACINQVCQGLISGLDYDIRAAVSAGMLSCPHCDYGIWRLVLAAVLIDEDELDSNLSLVPPELVEKPIIDMGTVEPCPACLAASECCDWLRTERQRLVTHMRVPGLEAKHHTQPGAGETDHFSRECAILEMGQGSVAESALKKQLRTLQTRADLGAACRARLEVLICQYKADLEDLEVMDRDTGVLMDGLEQDLIENGNLTE
ncbi:hypothetical protein FDENT_11408 [Fusarium denticulatum]|uniref:Uncharacterized protein n=1 Tax=Fusarium denticulatum TaxID=48507 RepID=A0A8H5TCX6_9HYPO|nr:hypothetical protein FDENT_11408 [Fusarium denticulatum]